LDDEKENKTKEENQDTFTQTESKNKRV